MRQRIITAIIALALLLAVLFVLPAKATKLVIAAVVLGGAWEWGGFVTSGRLRWRIASVATVGLLIAGLSIGLQGDVAALLKLALGGWAAALCWSFFYPTPVPTAVTLLAGIVALVPAYFALELLYDLGPLLLLFALLIVWAADSGAFFAGKVFGRVRLAPEISPGKTWEGVIGGLLAVAVLVLASSPWTTADVAVFLPFCLAVACLSVVGDLTVSMFKRSAGLKDSGTVFPGHGGILDRIDSVVAAAPLFALGVGYLGLRA